MFNLLGSTGLKVMLVLTKCEHKLLDADSSSLNGHQSY